jgi:multiple sugar transport system substrate-binding protein
MKFIKTSGSRLLILVVLVATIFSLAACTAAPTPTLAPAAPATTEVKPTDKPAEPTVKELSGKIRAIFWGNDNDVNSQKAGVKKFIELHPKVTVEVLEGNGCGADYAACKTMIAGGTMVDLFSSGIWDYNAMINDGGVVELLDPFMTRDNVKVSDFAAPAIAGMKALKDNKIYGLPMGFNVQSFWYNKDMFDKAGLKYPDPMGNYTWEDVRAWSKELTIDENGKTAKDPAFDPKKIKQWGYATWAATGSAPGYEPTLLAYGGSSMTLPDRQKCNMENPKSIEGWQLIQDMIYKDHTTVPPDAYQEMAGWQRWVTGTVAMQQGSGEQAMLVASTNPTLKYDMAALPKGPAGNASVVQMHIWNIWAGSKNKELAWEVLKFLATDGTCGNYGPNGEYSNMMGLVPAYKDLALGECFAKAKGEPANVAAAQLEPLKWPLTTYPGTYNQKTDMLNGQDGFGPALASLTTNEKSAADSLKGVCDKVNALMLK